MLFQLADHPVQHGSQPAPQQEKLVMLRNPEPRKPFSHRMDLLPGAAIDIIEHVLYFDLSALHSFFQFLCVKDYPTQRE